MNAHQEVATFAVKDRRSSAVSAATPAPDIGPAETFLAALRAGATVEQAEKVGEMLLRFQEAEAAREAERAFNAAFAKAMGEMPAIPKGKPANRGRAGTFYYAPIEVILGIAQPVLARNELHLGFDVVTGSDGSSVSVTAVVRHSGGHSIRSSASSKIVKFADANTILQNQQGTVTALQRTLSMALLGLAVGGEEEAAPYIADEPQGPDHNRISPFLQRIVRATDPSGDLRDVYNDAKRELSGEDYEAVKAAVWRKKSELETA